MGLKEMEQMRYLYSVVALLIYFCSIFLSTLIVYVVWTEQSLHEPMYIFICSLVGNVMVGSSAFLPKLAIDLLSGCTTISLSGCLTQAYFIQSCGVIEVVTFTIMAFDRYLAVGFPLRYHSLMINRKALQSLAIIWSGVLIVMLVAVLLVIRITICGNGINNVYCETLSLTRLSCGSTVINDIFGTTWTLVAFISSLMIVIYCYIRTFLVCLKISMEASQKAIHTLVTHIMTYSTFMAASLFVAFRYRLNSGSVSTVTHVVISITGLLVSVTINPLIYGIRTEALRIKMIHTLKEIIQRQNWGFEGWKAACFSGMEWAWLMMLGVVALSLERLMKSQREQKQKREPQMFVGFSGV
ncbi:olfactory receptor 4B13-like [Dendropsophus ebraccatus]|uniref:olfactory receptor 4B13-like n=1 Tax=Dendropsophus ebraccatus TaxID=150705 RepID=UPI003831D3C9